MNRMCLRHVYLLPPWLPLIHIISQLVIYHSSFFQSLLAFSLCV